jgi:hypothetical protein
MAVVSVGGVVEREASKATRSGAPDAFTRRTARLSTGAGRAAAAASRAEAACAREERRRRWDWSSESSPRETLTFRDEACNAKAASLSPASLRGGGGEAAACVHEEWEHTITSGA